MNSRKSDSRSDVNRVETGHHSHMGKDLIEKYSDEWARDLLVVVTQSDDEDGDSSSNANDEDAEKSANLRKSQNKRLDFDVYDPFAEEGIINKDGNHIDNCILPLDSDLNESQEKIWSAEFSEFQEQYAPSVMLFGISSLAASSMATDTTTSSATTATTDTASTPIKKGACRGSREKVSWKSSVTGEMTRAEVEETHERAKHHLELEDFEEALYLFQQILEAKRMKYGARAHASVGAALHNIAAVHLRAKQFQRALIVSTEALLTRRKALGNDHLDVSQTLLQLGTIQIAIRDYDSALNSLQEALTIRRSASSNLVGSARKNARNSNAMQIGNILSRIGLLHYEVEEYLSAATAFEEALHIYRSCLSQDSCPHAVIAETLVNLGSVRCKRKQYSQAIVAFEEAITIQKMEYGNFHPSVLYTIDSLVYAYSKYGSHDIGLNLYKRLIGDVKKVIKSLSRSSNDNSYHQKQELRLVCSRILHKMSILSEKLGHLPGAIDYTHQALEMQRHVYHDDNCSSDSDEEHPNIVATKGTLERLIAKQQKQMEGERTGIRGSQMKSPQSPRVVTAISDHCNVNTIKKSGRLRRLPKLLRLPALAGSSNTGSPLHHSR